MRVLERLIQFGLFLVLLTIGAFAWYYTIGRKPKLTLSTKFAAKDGVPATHLLPPGDVLLLVGTKATLYDMATGHEKWTANLPAPTKAPPAPPVVAAPLRPAIPPPAVPSPVATAPVEKADSLLEMRISRRFAKLEAWAARLNQKRGGLKSPLQIEAFNEEAAKYHAELVAARAEAATLHPPQRAALAAAAIGVGAGNEPATHLAPSFDPWEQTSEVFADGAIVWIVQRGRVVALDRANGRTTRDLPLAGEHAKVLLGAGCLYVITAMSDGTRQVTRLDSTTAKSLTVSSPVTEPRFAAGEQGAPATPTTQASRTEFSAAHGELVQVDIHLIERKVTERQIISGNSISDMEEADKKTTGGWSSDAAVISQTLARDAARDATGGGRERTDESTYEVTLRRPFAPAIAASAPVRVQGRPEIFSTATLDLVVAGQTLVAFDRNNRKRWESKLAHPLAFADAFEDDHDASSPLVATTAQPCLEELDRLYLFDKGFLSAFESATGKPLWRLPSIGIRKVQLDGRGTLYVSSANGTAESLKYRGLEDTLPIMLKVDARQGKILWKLEKYQDCFVSGGDVYATRETRNAEDAVNQVFDRSKAPQTRFKLYKLSTRDGEPQWEWFQTRRPLHIESAGKQVSLLFSDELQVIKSIAL